MPSDPSRRDRGRPGRRPGGSGSRPGSREGRSAVPHRPLRPRADPLVGRTLGGCKVLDRIASDTVCTTYKADQAAMGRLVALRVLLPEVAADEVTLARFYETAKFAAQLHHPNIASIYDASSSDGRHFSTQEYVEGRSLSDILRAKQGLATSDALRVVVDVAEAHRFANAKGMPGLTVSADRIFLTPRGEVKLLPPTFTPAGAPVLGDAYLLPALGVLLYAMLTRGRVPDLGAALEAAPTAAAQLPPVKTAALGLRPEVVAIVDRLLGLVPENPYSSAEDVVVDLHRFLEAQEKVENRTRTATERAQERQKQTLQVLLIAGGGCAVALIIVICLVYRSGAKREAVETEFDRTRLAADDLWTQAKRAEADFTKAPSRATADHASSLLTRAAETYRQFQAAHPGEAKGTDAGYFATSVEGELRGFRETVKVKMRAIEAVDLLKATDKSIEDDIAYRADHGGKLDLEGWQARYQKLARDTADVGGMADSIAGRLRTLPSKVDRATMRIEARQIERDYDEKYSLHHQFGKCLEVWRAFRRKHENNPLFGNEAVRKWETNDAMVRNQARVVYNLENMHAKDFAQKGDYAKARETYESIIKNFGIPEYTDKATDALAKLPKE